MPNRKEISEEKVGGKKRGFVSRQWHSFRNIDWSNPANRWKAIFSGTVGLLVIIGFSIAAVQFTNTTTFCRFCHEMAPEYATVSVSSHSNVDCVTCHIPPDGTLPMMVHKVKSLKEVYFHITGKPNPIRQTVGEVIPNRTCETCHSENRLINPTGDVIVSHQNHVDKGILCVNCHAGVAHGKIVERDLNDTDSLEKWDDEDKLTAKKLTPMATRNPNMGTCIDCHLKVNEGDMSYLKPEYAVPHMTENDDHTKKSEMIIEDSGQTQTRILQALKDEQTESKISMACATCHKKTGVPEDHEEVSWKSKHGPTAWADVDKCLSCHKDELWSKRLAPENREQLLNGLTQMRHDTTEEIRNVVRENQFCSTCHEERPPSHQDTAWSKTHASSGKTATAKESCYVCHNETKVNSGETAPSAVYCAYCHK